MISKTKSTGKGPFVREGSEHTSKLSAQRPAPKAGLAQSATLMEEILSPTCGQGPVLPMASPSPGTPGRVADGNAVGPCSPLSPMFGRPGRIKAARRPAGASPGTDVCTLLMEIWGVSACFAQGTEASVLSICGGLAQPTQAHLLRSSSLGEGVCEELSGGAGLASPASL